MKLESSSFENGGTIPKKFGYKNGNNSPSLIIHNIPESTKSLALIMDDPDAMGAVGKVWVHWVLWNISKDVKKIDENSVPENSIEGETDFGEIGYGGPAPPDKEHTYVFKLYALDKTLELNKGSTKKDLENSMQGHIISEAKLTGKYAPQ
ncbi:PEBP family protein [Marine Group I thaumarchaeote SCGC AAA799-E16]|uniref:PEBP family protein n=2 Tax=Marine Group I TaxID=905826 RepID=A0A087S4C5_9ARCH|nr:PEBP family protein [Marine Group I thaumarchaeote SCGC AAA799-E16]KFM20579.1 PEBP family protein [Marine Group I thaumarchaeote SCGC RSA3]